MIFPGIADVSDAEKKIRLEKQKTDKWDAFAEVSARRRGDRVKSEGD